MSQTTEAQPGIDEAAYYSLVLNSAGREYATICLLGGLYGRSNLGGDIALLTIWLGVLAVLSFLSARALTQYVFSNILLFSL